MCSAERAGGKAQAESAEEELQGSWDEGGIMKQCAGKCGARQAVGGVSEAASSSLSLFLSQTPSAGAKPTEMGHSLQFLAL